MARRSPRTSSARSFRDAAERWKKVGVDANRALKILARIPLSLPCWQGDDVSGFETTRTEMGGGLAVTGRYPGRARTAEERRADFEQARRLIPGPCRFNLHAIYGEFARPVDRDEIEPRHFQTWIDWARRKKLGLDFNPTCFAHPMAADGFTLSHRDPRVRAFWIEHCRRARRIGAAMGRALGQPCVTNLWVPDGFKDTPADRRGPRERLLESLDAVFRESLPTRHLLDSVESKLFGIGAESCTVGSHEFYLGYAISRRKMVCLDSGHFHPTESIADKLSALLPFVPAVLLHLSRGVRWDSDHVVTLTDELMAVLREVVANDYLDRVHLGLDSFDASINRLAAWVIGARSVKRALLWALLEPPAIRAAEQIGDFTARLAWQEETRSLPFAPVWERFCETENVPSDTGWLAEIRRYEAAVLSRRDG